MDEYYKEHDIAYAEARIRARENQKGCNARNNDEVQSQLKKDLKKANQDLYRKLKQLNDDPTKWPKSAPAPAEARKKRYWAQVYFHWR